MEWPWPEQKCILCLREEEKLSRAHLFPEMLGGFLWSRTHCKDCNSFFGHEVEAAAKRDDSFRHAIERELAGELPDLADSFSEGQSYIARAEDGSLIRGARRHGEHRVGASTSEEGTLTQSREQAREGIETRLRRDGISEEDITGALERFDAAPEGVLTEILPGLGIKHGSVEGWDLPFDGGESQKSSRRRLPSISSPCISDGRSIARSSTRCERRSEQQASSRPRSSSKVV